MTINPGYGTDDIHLGQSASALKAFLGSPTKRRKSGSLREYWVYKPLHFEAIVSQKTGRLLSLFFHEGCPLGNEQLYGLTEAKVRKEFHEPALRAEGFQISDDTYFDGYLIYDEGISFFFGDSGKVKTVVISSPKRKATANRSTSKRLSPRSHRGALAVAALRR